MNSSCEYNDDELKPPAWINKQLLEAVLKNMKNFENHVISTFTIQPASKKGDHYASIMFRATIECTHETYMKTETNKKSQILKVIIKTRPPLDTPKGRNLSETQIFENEWKMYTQVIPLMEEEWQRYNVKLKVAGRLLYATLHPQPVIVLEDLCLNGYDILRGGRLFNLSEVEACLRKLAKWHAVSYKLTANARNNVEVTQQVSFVSGVATKYNDSTRSSSSSSSNVSNVSSIIRDNTIIQMQYGLFKQKNLLRTAYISEGVHRMIKALEDYNNSDGSMKEVTDSVTATAVTHTCGLRNDNMAGCGKVVGITQDSYLLKLRLLEPRIIAACIAMNDAFLNGICGPIYVLNHGDFHTMNIMIKSNQAQNGEHLNEDDIIFIDFQMCFFGPSTFDLQYASFTLLSKELRDHKRNYLMKYYFEHFLESLLQLEFKGILPSFEQFELDCKRWRYYEIYLLAVNLPLTCLNTQKKHEVDVNQIFDSSEYREKFYRNPDYLNYLQKILPKYLEEGYLD